MHKLGVGVMAVTLVSSLALFAQAGRSPSQYCDANQNFGVSHDACVVCVSKGGYDKATCECKLLQDNYFGESLQDAGFSSYGDCVSALNSGAN